MQINFKKTGKLLKAAFKEWWAKDPFKESAVIAFYAIFSMPGLLVVIITIAGYFFGADAVNNRLASQISSTMGADTAKQVQSGWFHRFNFIMGLIYLNDSFLRSRVYTCLCGTARWLYSS